MQERVNAQIYCDFMGIFGSSTWVLFRHGLLLLPAQHQTLMSQLHGLSNSNYQFLKKNLYFQTHTRKSLFSCLNLFILMIGYCLNFHDWKFLMSFLIACCLMHMCFFSSRLLDCLTSHITSCLPIFCWWHNFCLPVPLKWI